MAKITFILGGARSGKSAFAEELAKKYNDVVYIATAEIKDDEIRERVKAHRARRPFNWKTIESPFHVNEVISNLNEKAGLVFIDCITLYITNMLLSDEMSMSGGEQPFSPTVTKDDQNPIKSPFSKVGLSGINKECDGEKTHLAGCASMQREILKQKHSQILAEINKLSQVCRDSKSEGLIVSNEVGLGIVPDNAISRMFRDITGSANQILADEADEVYFMVAGIAQRIK